MHPSAMVLNARCLLPAASKAGGKQHYFSPHSQHLPAKYYLILSYSSENLMFITDMSIASLPGFQPCAWCISMKFGNQN